MLAAATRIMLDPQVYSYYTASVLLGALIWDIQVRPGRIVPLWTWSVFGALFGSRYLAPEISQGYAVAPAADVYSLGVVLFELVTGHLPFAGDDPHVVTMARVARPVPYPPGIGPALGDVLRRLLDKGPCRRPSASEAAALLLSPPRGAP